MCSVDICSRANRRSSGWWSLRRNGINKKILVPAALLTAGVFAAQMFNAAVLPSTSAHLVGGVMLAWSLGPSVALVLSTQALLLGDGEFVPRPDSCNLHPATLSRH